MAAELLPTIVFQKLNFHYESSESSGAGLSLLF